MSRNSYTAGSRAALAMFSKKAALPAISPAQRAATALIQGGSSLALNLAMAPQGDKMRQAGIGAASDALGGYIGGLKGMGASLATNMALQKLTAPSQPPPVPAPVPEMQFKEADHADDRLKQRIKDALPSGALDDLREQAKGLEVAPGRYYLNVKNKAGKPVAVAAFKTVGKDHQLVLATILKPRNKPPSGSSLSHLMKQPK